MAAHIAEHAAFQYRVEIEKELGVPLPPPDEPLPKDIEVRLSTMMAEAGARLLGRDVQEAELEEQKQKMKDPVIQQQERELELKKAQIEQKASSDAAKIAADLEKAKMRDAVERERIKSQADATRLQGTIDLTKEVVKQEMDTKRLTFKERESAARDAAEGARTATKIVEVAAKIAKGPKE